MQDYNEQTFAFTPVRGCRVEAVFDEPAVTSDGGAILLREILERSQLLADIAHALVRRHGVNPRLLALLGDMGSTLDF